MFSILKYFWNVEKGLRSQSIIAISLERWFLQLKSECTFVRIERSLNVTETKNFKNNLQAPKSFCIVTSFLLWFESVGWFENNLKSFMSARERSTYSLVISFAISAITESIIVGSFKYTYVCDRKYSTTSLRCVVFPSNTSIIRRIILTTIGNSETYARERAITSRVPLNEVTFKLLEGVKRRFSISSEICWLKKLIGWYCESNYEKYVESFWTLSFSSFFEWSLTSLLSWILK